MKQVGDFTISTRIGHIEKEDTWVVEVKIEGDDTSLYLGPFKTRKLAEQKVEQFYRDFPRKVSEKFADRGLRCESEMKKEVMH